MPSMSASKYSTLRTCPRLFYWEQVRYLERAREDGARGFGTMYHAGLEAWWKTAGDGETPWADQSLVAALKAIGEKSNHIDTNVYDQMKAEAMMTVYHARWIDVEFERIGEGAEVFFRVPLLDPDGREVKGWSLTGKKDAFVKLAHLTKVTPVEHKTTGSDLTEGSDYWKRIEVDGQISGYIDAARATGFDCDSAFYDVSRKPDISPELETPEEKRKMTKGRGCSTCGGKASGDVAPGTGVATLKKGTKKFKEHFLALDPDWKPDANVESVDIQCPDCEGKGWRDEPRWAAGVRLEDEPPLDYKARVLEKLAGNPESYFKQARVPRTDSQIREARADLVCATVEIDNYYNHARRIAKSVDDPNARFAFPRNTNTCLNIYGRRCDFLDVCSGAVPEPSQSNLYRIRDRNAAQGVKK